MSMLEPVCKAGAWLANRYAMHRRSDEFSCGDCPMWESCGEPPRADCPVRLQEIASGNWRTRRIGRVVIGL